MDKSDTYHSLAKDAGNRLRAYILSVASGATGVFFLSLTNEDARAFSSSEKWLLSIALVAFVFTVIICLYELRIDARRFFALAKEHEKQEDQRDWTENEAYKKLRILLIHGSYITLGVGILSTCVYLIMKITTA